ncbi:MAG: TIGR04076 family protein [Candidatus Thorarchaeota archaeon]
MSKIRITVLKGLSRSEVFGDDIPDIIDKPKSPGGRCGRHTTGQTFISDDLRKPEGFCDWAFTDIHRDLTYLAFGNKFNDFDKIQYAACTDGTNPVIFKLERID